MAKLHKFRTREVRPRRHRPHLNFERVEDRLLLATFVVTTTADNGIDTAPTPGSLRQAIVEANAATSVDSSLIMFDIDGGGSRTIKPPAELPAIVRPVVLDATTQPGFAGSPIVELDGSGSGPGANGLVLTAGDSQVRGFAIVRFGAEGIILSGGGGDVIQGNNIGTDTSGTTSPATGPVGNGQGGIFITNAGMNTIGGAGPGQRNVIVNNGGDGITILVGVGQRILGNAIGVDSTGALLLPNGGNGIRIEAASNATIGGTVAGSANLIAGNADNGILLGIGGGNLVEGNLIGGSVSQKSPNTNLGNGIALKISSNNTIGGLTASARNVISGNAGNGIEVGAGSKGNLIVGDFIGPDVTGMSTPFAPISGNAGGNGGDGILITLASNNTVGGTAQGAGNVISGNFGGGVSITNDLPTQPLLDPRATKNVVQGNIIGLDVGGTKDLGNLSNGVSVVSSPGNTIGGAEAGAGNVISANGGSGVVVQSNVSMSNVILGNRIGTDASGVTAHGNLLSGVTIENAPANTIGGSLPGQRNVISSNFVDGVQVIGQGSAGTSLIGNFIGLDGTGSARLPNLQDGVIVVDASGIVIGGLAPGESNVVSGNGANGFNIIGADSRGVMVLGNLVGTDSSGFRAIGNSYDGVAIAGAKGTLITGSVGAPSVIAGNGRNGIEVSLGGTGTVIRANLIGTNSLGMPLGNAIDGVKVADSPSNQIGGTGPGDGNTIEFNQQDGVEVDGMPSTGNAVQGNLILANGVDGVRFSNASDGTVGNDAGNVDSSAARGARNVISGNGGAGIEISGISMRETVQGNLIGTDISGTASLGNEIGVFLNDAVGNTIGGVTTAARNVISGNRSQGIQVFRVSPVGTGDVIEGNWIGVDATGLNALGNGVPGSMVGIGVFLNDAPRNTVGGTMPAAANVISGNGQSGISILGSSSIGNQVEGNVLGASPSGGLLPSKAPRQFVGVLLQDSAGNTIGGGAASSGNLIRGNTTGVEVTGVSSSDAILFNRVDQNTFGIYLNGAAGSQIMSNSITDNDDIGLSILGNLSTNNVAQGNAIDRNAFAGVYIEGATGNTIGTQDSRSSPKPGLNLPNSISRNKSVGVYLFGGATGNAFRRNLIKNNGLYGAFLYNSAGNVPGIVRSGPDANQIMGSGIANFREFTGPVNKLQALLLPSRNSARKH